MNIYKNWKHDPNMVFEALNKTIDNYPKSLQGVQAAKELGAFQGWIINKDIWPKGVYRLMSRYYVVDDYRDKGNTRTHRGEGYHIGHIILNDQLEYLKNNLDSIIKH